MLVLLMSGVVLPSLKSLLLSREAPVDVILPERGAATAHGCEVFRLWAKLMHGQSSALYENVMIAAMAKVHNLIGVTRNIRDFERFNLPLFNPFEYR